MVIVMTLIASNMATKKPTNEKSANITVEVVSSKILKMHKIKRMVSAGKVIAYSKVSSRAIAVINQREIWHRQIVKYKRANGVGLKKVAYTKNLNEKRL